MFDDEAFSCQRYVLPLDEMVSALWRGVEPDPPLYYVLQNLAVRIFGVGPLGLRALSIMMFLGGLVAMRAAAEAWFDRRTGIVTLVICALHPAHLFFGFAARWYSTMFLAVAVLLWTTQRLKSVESAHDGAARVEPANSRFRSTPLHWIIAWSFSAAAVCYTNYFGPVVVGLVWLVAIFSQREKRHWLVAALLTGLLFAPWLPPFWKQATSFPQVGGGSTAYLATAARTLMALLAGDLASHRASYVWTPIAIFCLCVGLLLVHQRQQVRSIALITLGCFIAGVASRTMIDKYIMTFSGPACMVVSALLIGAWRAERADARRAARVATAALALSWAGCGFNLVTERNWSSLRWLDPFDSVIREWAEKGNPPELVLSHPSAGYYLGYRSLRMPVQLLVQDTEMGFRHKIEKPPLFRWPTPDAFRDFARLTHDGRADVNEWGLFGTLPCDMVRKMRYVADKYHRRLPKILTIETSEFADAPAWSELRALLAAQYEMTAEEKYAEDPDADWKDRLDPTFKHPRWRIVVRRWVRKEP